MMELLRGMEITLHINIPLFIGLLIVGCILASVIRKRNRKKKEEKPYPAWLDEPGVKIRITSHGQDEYAKQFGLIREAEESNIEFGKRIRVAQKKAGITFPLEDVNET